MTDFSSMKPDVMADAAEAKRGNFSVVNSGKETGNKRP